MTVGHASLFAHSKQTATFDDLQSLKSFQNVWEWPSRFTYLGRMPSGIEQIFYPDIILVQFSKLFLVLKKISIHGRKISGLQSVRNSMCHVWKIKELFVILNWKRIRELIACSLVKLSGSILIKTSDLHSMQKIHFWHKSRSIGSFTRVAIDLACILNLTWRIQK